MITEIFLGLGGIVLVIAIALLFAILCVNVGHLFGYKDLHEWDSGSAYWGMCILVSVGLIIFGLYKLGGWMLANW